MRVARQFFPSVDLSQPVRYTYGEHGIKLFFLNHTYQHEDWLSVFTDGSKYDADVGFGAVFPDFSRCASLPRYASVLSAELSAILLALCAVCLLQVKRLAFFFSGDNVALLFIESNLNFHPLILHTFTWLTLWCIRGYNISFCWMPSHESIERTERGGH